jgi:acyl carrier protein
MPAREADWEDFVAAVAAAAQVREDAISPATRLGTDLGVDSLALTEVVVMLIVDFDMDGLSDQLDQRQWGSVTVGELYDEYRAGGHDRVK